MVETVREAKFGKTLLRLVKTAAGHAGLVFRDNAIQTRIDAGTPGEIWGKLQAEAGKGSPSYIGHEGAKNRFLRIFGGGFDKPAYTEHERKYKVEAKKRLDAEAPLEKAREASGLGEIILRVFQATNLLSPFEKMRIQDVLGSKQADSFIHAAAEFTAGDAAALGRMESILKPYDAAKWTTVTYLPFLWKPDRHMFLKPEVTKAFAERVGHPFAHEYEPRLVDRVYTSLLDLAASLERELIGLHPADRIDLQSFIWVVGEYTATDEAEVPGAPA